LQPAAEGTLCTVTMQAGGGAELDDLMLPLDRGPEAYTLQVAEGGARVAATARAGLRYGAITLLHLAIEAAGKGDGIPAVEIVDWPSLPVRGITIPLPTDRWGHPNDAPVDPAFWERFLLRTCLEQKLNTVVILVRQGMRYRLHPEIDGPAAWPQETVRGIVEALKAHDITPIPLLDSLGHANWLVIPEKQLREDGDTHTLCTRHPDSRFLLDCYDEIMDVFSPTHFHMGLDEIRWVTGNTPEENRCKLCAGIDKREIFLEQVQVLCDHLRVRGIVPMMWGDMVLKAHNGGPPFHLDDTLEQLPREIVITNWSITLDQLSNHLFHRLGFPVVQSNSTGVSVAQAPWVRGNFFGCWAKHPWLTEGAPGVGTEFSYLCVLTAAEYSWNLCPDATTLSVPVEGAFFEQRREALTRLGLGGPVGQTTAVAGPGLSARRCDAGRLSFTAWEAPAAPTAEAPVSVRLSAPARALYLLVSAEVPPEQSEAFRKRFTVRDTWQGVPVATVRVQLADGTERVWPIRYGTDVRDAVGEELGFAYNAIGYWADEQGRTWYALQWEAAKADGSAEGIVIEHAGTEAQPLVLGASVGR